jgi:hypothetical protein
MQTFLSNSLFLVGIYLVDLALVTILVNFMELKSMYLSFLSSVFGIDRVPNENDNIVVDLYGTKMNISTHKTSRISLKTIAILCIHMVSVIFIDGCILSAHHLKSTNMCPVESVTICFHSEFNLYTDSVRFYCPPNQPILAMNITSPFISCFSLTILSQTIASILNQLGICSSILALLGVAFRCLYYLTNWKFWGILINVSLVLAITIIFHVLMFVARITLSQLAILLLISAVVLLGNALVLVFITRKFQLTKTTVNSNDVELGPF